jgi:hypothetical protein
MELLELAFGSNWATKNALGPRTVRCRPWSRAIFTKREDACGRRIWPHYLVHIYRCGRQLSATTAPSTAQALQKKLAAFCKYALAA